MSTSFQQARDLSEWSEAAVNRYLRTYKHGVIPDSALASLGPLINGRELRAKVNEPGLDQYLREAINTAIEDPQYAWEECTRLDEVSVLELGENFSWLREGLLNTEEASRSFFRETPKAIENADLPIFITRRAAAVWFLVILGIALIETVLAPTLTQWFAFSSSGEFQKSFARFSLIALVFTGGCFVGSWILLWLMFYPLRFRGWNRIHNSNLGCPLGWQGLIPFRAGDKARLVVRMIRRHVLNENEMFSRLNPQELSRILQRPLSARLEIAIETIAMEEAPTLWTHMPKAAKQQVYELAAAESAIALNDIFTHITAEVDQLLNVEHLVADLFVQDPLICTRVFLACFSTDFVFARSSLTRMSLASGLFQVILSYAFPSWFLIISGAVHGGLLSAATVLLLFYPLQSKTFCHGKVRLQGEVVERQVEIAQTMAAIAARYILTSSTLLKEFVQGNSKTRVRQIVRDGIFRAVESSFGPISTFIPMAVQQRVIDRCGQIINDSLLEILASAEDYFDRTFELQQTISYRLARLDRSAFRDTIWDIFQEEISQFILAGMGIGFLLGLLQCLILLGFSRF